MNHRTFFLTAGIILACCTACVDPILDLSKVETRGVVFQNMEVPIGNFEEITLNDILKAPGASLISLQPGIYSLTGSVEVTGISLRLNNQLYFKEAELHTVIVNTLPLDMDFRVSALDEAGNPCQRVPQRQACRPRHFAR